MNQQIIVMVVMKTSQSLWNHRQKCQRLNSIQEDDLLNEVAPSIYNKSQGPVADINQWNLEEVWKKGSTIRPDEKNGERRESLAHRAE